MDFTIIICTYNRSRNLPKCIECLDQQQGSEGFDWEVLIVDNNSSDETRQVVEQLAKSSKVQLRYAFEQQQGLNCARNRGIEESTGRYICYVDDDILVDRNWLAALFRSLESHDADAVGGRIHLDPQIALPGWIGPEVRGFLGYQDYGEESFRMDGKVQYPYGGNMSFHRRVVGRIGMFDPKFGRKGEGRKRSELFKGAETEFFHRLSAAGDARIYYEPGAIVYHRILPHQLTRRYFLTIHYNAGLQKAFYDSNDFEHRLLGVPRFIYRQTAGAAFSYLGQLITHGSDRAFRQLMTFGHFLGMMQGYRKAYRKA